MSSDAPLSRRGIFFGLAAFGTWGLLPIYFKAVSTASAVEVLCHRILWSLLFLAVLIAWQGRWREVFEAVRNGPNLRRLSLTTLLIATNWFLFIWAVANDRVLETSLGYFINPLVVVALAVVLLRERLSRIAALSVALAAVGVGIQVVLAGTLPVIALVLAFSFGTYGLLRKTASVGSVVGLFVEVVLLSPFALGWLMWLSSKGELAFLAGNWWLDLLLCAAGVVTAVPLLFFTQGARLLPLSVMGILQYIAPSLTFLMAVFLFGEPLGFPQLLTFGFIWTALALFTFDRIRRSARVVV